MALKRIHKVRPSPAARTDAGLAAVTEPDRGAPAGRRGEARGQGAGGRPGLAAFRRTGRRCPALPPPPRRRDVAPGNSGGRQGARGRQRGAGRRRPGAAEADAARAVLSRGFAARTGAGLWPVAARPGTASAGPLGSSPRPGRATLCGAGRGPRLGVFAAAGAGLRFEPLGAEESGALCAPSGGPAVPL